MQNIYGDLVQKFRSGLHDLKMLGPLYNERSGRPERIQINILKDKISGNIKCIT